LYGGAIHQAGAVKARKSQRHATSDWMALEQERGISVTSSVLQFEYLGYQVNLLDTPGHQDFGEDTFRTLVAADSAVMLLDNRKGVEERTRQLFDVCRRRRMPIFTVVNKCDRVGEDPLKLVSDLEAELGITAVAAHWPIHMDSAEHGSVFVGVYDRLHQRAHLFERGKHHGARRVTTATLDLATPGDARLTAALGGSEEAVAAVAKLAHDVELLDMAGHGFDPVAILAGEQTPVFFASALTNFGVEPFLEAFLPLAPSPVARESSAGPVAPGLGAFTAFVFKVQANMDPRHRDRVAFLRVCSGRYEAGLDVTHVRSGKSFKLAPPQQFMGRERAFAEEALPGDVVGVHDRGLLRIGDTLATEDAPRDAEGNLLAYVGIPRFAPEHFARIVSKDPLRRKALDKGLRELTEEGAAQVFYAESQMGPVPIVGAVGLLQFDVMVHRLENEYGAPCQLENLPFRYPRWVTGPEEEIQRLGESQDLSLLYDYQNRPVLLFRDEWRLRWAVDRHTSLTFHEAAP
ncbi:MAG: peptide chain release factor 3, partial [Gemmatimonadota bacterium]|nr:peptide chain release factor 3 [Gemmatimonadota bacterium]